MSAVHRGWLVVPAMLFVAACSTGGAQPTPAQSTVRPSSVQPTSVQPTSAQPTSAQPPSQAPTPMASELPPSAGATVEPGSSLDPTKSDAGIAARVTLSGDTNMGRDGTYDVYGVDADGSECNGSFEEPDYTVVAWVNDAPFGEIFRFGITVKADQIPSSNGSTSVSDGRLSFDFNSETGFGTQYTAAPPDDGTLALNITRSGDGLTFDFDGTTKAGVQLTGQLICTET